MHIFDDDDFMTTTPRDNFFSIAKNANENIVDMELEKMLRRLAVAERVLEENGLEEAYERAVEASVVDSDIDNRLDSIFIELVGNIVTQCE